jgi:hypothetical protein
MVIVSLLLFAGTIVSWIILPGGVEASQVETVGQAVAEPA